MRAVVSVGDAHVWDDVLSNKMFQQLWEQMNAWQYSRTDAVSWTKVWTIADGAILRGPQYMAMGPSWTITPPKIVGAPPLELDPPPLVALVKRVLEMCDEKSVKGVKRIIMMPYVWPPKSSISWHADGTESQKSRVGAFTFYAHKEWNIEWGGEFLLSKAAAVNNPTPFDNSVQSDKIMASGYGTWVSPKPNRILMNPSNMMHKVTKTTEHAAPRLSIQGFLYTE